MRCRLGFHRYATLGCYTTCERGCGAVRGHDWRKHSDHVTNSNWLGEVTSESLKEWRQCHACGEQEKPTIDWFKRRDED